MYKNPVVSIDDERVSNEYCLIFTFDEAVTLEEATNGINNIIMENGGVLKDWVRMGIPSIRYTLPQN